MHSFRYSVKKGAFYLFVGVILLLLGAGLIGIAIVGIGTASQYSTTYHNSKESSLSIWFILGGGVLCFFAISNFINVFKQRFIKYVVSETGLHCHEYGKELFIPFEQLGMSETELTAIISDRRTKNMITVTNDLEDYNHFVNLVKSKGKR
jgi:hypothetical protein